MKSFKEYLLESKQTYNFKVKIVGEQDKTAADKIKSALGQFKVESFSAGKRTPIQETQADFPTHQNVNVTIYDVELGYPANTLQLQNLIVEALNISHGCVRVRNIHEQHEEELNHQHDTKTGESLLGKDYSEECHQDIVGDNQVMSLLKELNKTKHQGDTYTGVNDSLLAKKAPVEKTSTKKVDQKIGTTSAIGSKKIEKPTVAKIGK